MARDYLLLSVVIKRKLIHHKQYGDVSKYLQDLVLNGTNDIKEITMAINTTFGFDDKELNERREELIEHFNKLKDDKGISN